MKSPKGIENEDGDITLAELRDLKFGVMCPECGKNAWSLRRMQQGKSWVWTWKCWNGCVLPLRSSAEVE